MEDNQKKPQQTFKVTVKRPSPVRELGRYAVEEVIVPQTRDMMSNFFKSMINMASDAATKTIDRAMYPDGNAPRRNKSTGDGTRTYQPKVNYSTKVYNNDSRPQKESISTRSSIDVNDIWVDNQEQAKEIVSGLKELIDNYGKAKVADLYENLRDENGNKIPTTFPDYKFGWADSSAINSYYDSRVGKYYIDLPKPINIENI